MDADKWPATSQDPLDFLYVWVSRVPLALRAMSLDREVIRQKKFWKSPYHMTLLSKDSCESF